MDEAIHSNDTNDEHEEEEEDEEKTSIEMETDRPDVESSSFLHSIRYDQDFRRRILHTVVMTWTFVAMGWVINLAGPTLPDLRRMATVSLDTAAWLMTSAAFGNVVGSTLGGLLFDRYNKLTVLITCTAGMAITTALVPVFPVFAAMLGIKFINEVFVGGINTGVNAYLPYLWGRRCGPFIQLLHFGIGLGAILGNIATEPFLSESRDRKLFSADAHNNVSMELYDSENKIYMNESKATADCKDCVTLGDGHNLTLPCRRQCVQYGNNESTVFIDDYDEESLIYFAFVIPAAYMILATVFIICLKRVRVENIHPDKVRVENISSGKVCKQGFDNSSPVRPGLPYLTARQKMLFLCLISCLSSLLHGFEKGYSQFFMTFAITFAGMSKLSASLMASTFWFGFTGGRFLAIFISGYFRPRNVLFFSNIFLLASLCGFAVSIHYLYTPMMWMFNAIAGISYSVAVPSMFTWAATEVFQLTGTVTAVTLVAVNVVAMVLPLIFGNLMDRFSQIWFVYLLIIAVGLSLVTSVIISVLLAKLKRQTIKRNKQVSAQTIL